MRRAFAIFLVIALAGCAMQEMDPGGEADVGNGITVTPQPGFAQIHFAGLRYWTKNGTGLDELNFYTGVKNGEPLFVVPGVARKDLPVYRDRMTPNDIADLAATALGKKGMQNVRVSALRPCPFGAAPGFCFDLSLANDEGLEMRGKAIARARSGMLDLLIFTAPAEYYFADLSPVMAQIFASIQAK